MTTLPPHASTANFHEIYYGTDDGFPKSDPRQEVHDAAHVARLYDIYARYADFHRRMPPARRDHIHLTSVVGGLYGLNLISLFQPKEMTFFDVNPRQIAYFNILRRVWSESRNADQFLAKLTHADYDVDTADEGVIRRCIAAKQDGTITVEQATSRSLLSSWRYALDHFELTRQLLAEVPVRTRVDDMQSKSFAEFVASHENVWLYCSNVMLFSFFDLRFRYPRNAALFASYFNKTEMIDLGGLGDEPVTVHCRTPMCELG